MEVVKDSGTYRIAGKSAPPYVIDLLLNQVLHPFGMSSDAKEWFPELRTEKFGKTKLDCIMLYASTRGSSQPLGMLTTYCIDPDTDRLRVTLDVGSESIAREKLGIFQGRSVPLDISIAFNSIKAAEGHVEALSEVTPQEHLFDIDSSFALPSAVDVSPKDLAGLILTKSAPIFPEDAKRNHRGGTVIMRARIGANGRVEKLDLVSAPGESLGASAMAAVRQWTYKPYVLNGVVVPIETTIVVHFNFGM